VDAVQKAVQSSDAVSVQRAAHALKGAVANFAAEPATQAAHTIEAMGRAGDLTGAPAALPPLRQELDLLAQELAAYRSAHTGGAPP
jgi:two-component system sensor histidine kinase/response regulator